MLIAWRLLGIMRVSGNLVGTNRGECVSSFISF